MNPSKQKIETIKLKYPDRIPVIVNKSKNSNAPDLDKHKYLVPIDLTLGQFIYVIRKRMEISPEQAIFVFCKDTLPPTSMIMEELYNGYKNSNEFLELTYNIENTFGNMPKILSFFNPILHPTHNFYNINKIFNKYKNKNKNLTNLNKNNILFNTNILYDNNILSLNNNSHIIHKSSIYYPPYYSSDDSDFIDISSSDDSDLSSSSETPIQDKTVHSQIHNNIHNFTTYAPFFSTSSV